MTIKPSYKTLPTAAFAAFTMTMMLASAPTKSAPTQTEVNEVFETRVLAESGWTYPAIEDMQKARREAAQRTERTKATNVRADEETERDDKSVANRSAREAGHPFSY